jgi:putative ABC transport system substrate-binding protein
MCGRSDDNSAGSGSGGHSARRQTYVFDYTLDSMDESAKAIMRRRKFIWLLGGAVASLPFAAHAQQMRKVRRIGFLWDSPDVFADAIQAFQQRLHDLGYVDGKTITIEYRWAKGNPERMRELANELVGLQVDLLVAPTSVYTGVAKSATSNIPVIFMSHADPVGSGHVNSLGHPGGNVTGFSLMMTETNVKGLELLKEAIPTLSRIAVIFDPATPSHRPGLKAVEAAAPSIGMRVQPVPVRVATEYKSAFAAMVRERADGVLVLSTPLFIAGARPLAQLAMTHKLPSLFGPRHHVDAGGLMSYSPDRADLWRRGADYVDRILRGEKPADLPVQRPTKFELAINVKTAKAIGVTIPPTLLARADKLIE